MRRLLLTIAALALMAEGTWHRVQAQVGSPLPSTLYTRQFLRAADSNAAWVVLGLAPTNATKITNVITQVDAGTTNAWRMDGTNISSVAAQNPTNSAAYSPLVMHKGKPPMHFNSFYSMSPAGGPTRAAMLTWANIIKTNGFLDAGYDTLVYDVGWQYTNRDAAGRLQSFTNDYTIDATTVPAMLPAGMTMSNHVAELHALGFKVGVYTTPDDQIPSVQYLPGTGPTNIERDAQTFADWGVDFVKFDDVYPTTPAQMGYVQRFAKAFQAARPTGHVRVGFGSTDNPETNSWVFDWLSDYQASYDGFAQDITGANYIEDSLVFVHNLDQAMYFNSRYAQSGAYAAADAMPFGSDAGQAWLVMGASCVCGVALEMKHFPAATDGSYWTIVGPIVKNREAIDVNQNWKGKPFIALDSGHGASTNRHADPHGYSVWAKAKDPGSSSSQIALSLFNRDTNASVTITMNLTNVGIIAGTPVAIRDVRNNTNGWVTNSISYPLGVFSGSLLKLYPLLASEPTVSAAAAAPTATTNFSVLPLMNCSLYNNSAAWVFPSAYIRDLSTIGFNATYAGFGLLIDPTVGTANHGWYDWPVPRSALAGTNVDFIVHVAAVGVGTNYYTHLMGGWPDGGSSGYFQQAHHTPGTGAFATNELVSASAGLTEYWITNSFTIPQTNMNLFARWGNGASNAVISMYVLETAVRSRP